MATSIKTIQFAFPMNTSDIADATFYDFPQQTVYCPEMSGTVTWRSCFVEIGFQDIITATGGTITEHRVRCAVNGAGATTFTETDDLTNSGENMGGVIGPIDFTAQFTSNWTSGGTATLDIGVYFDQNSGSTLGMRNVTAIVYLTYEYDDTQATQIKTVMIPFDSPLAGLPTSSATELGTNQWPQLTSGGLLPETSPTIRDIFLLIEGNNSTLATTDYTISTKLDAEGAVSFGVVEAALNASQFVRYVWSRKASVPDTTTAHALYLYASLASRFSHCAVTLVVTYEFTVSGTTRWLSSIVAPMEIASPLGANSVTYQSRFQRSFRIMDPGTITLRQSGARLNFNVGAPIASFLLGIGAQTKRTYVHNASVLCGMNSVQQRFDSGGSAGAGITLARGDCEFTLDGYSTDTTDQMTNLSGVIYLNYECDFDGSPSKHPSTVMQVLAPWNAALQDRVVTDFAAAFPEASWWMIASGFLLTLWTSATASAVTFDCQVLSGENKGDGYMDIYADAYQSDAERGCTLAWMRGRDVFWRHPAEFDPDRLDPEATRRYRLFMATTSGSGVIAIYCRHGFTYTVSGTVSGYAGDGSGITVDVFRAATHERVLSLTTVAGGGYSGTWYNDVEDLYAVAREDSTHIGRSDNFTAT